MRQDNSHDTTGLFEVVKSMQEKGEVSLRLRRQSTEAREARILQEAICR